MIQMRIVYLVLACGLSGVIGAGGALYYVRNVTRPIAGSGAPALGANQTFSAPMPSVHTVSWYQAHPDQIKVKLAACNDSPGTAMHDPECYNAESAKEHGDIDRFIESAPKDAQPVVPRRQ
jgi:nitrate reductase alpha subunit